MEKTLKNIILAGIGALSYGAEKGAKVIEDLVKKGDLSFEQGKELKDELENKFDKAATAGSEAYKDIMANLNLASREDLQQLRAELEELKERVSKLEA